MFFYNARYSFTLDPTPDPVPGSIIASSCVSAVDLRKRKFSKFPHLQTRFLDPQLYMATVDPALQPALVERLASYPWFHGLDVPQYTSDEYKNPKDWKQQHKTTLLGKWSRRVPDDPVAIARSARAAVEMQIAIGCSAIILAGPLTTIEDQSFEKEIAWIEAGLTACSELGVQRKVYATVALAEATLHNVDPFGNPLIHTISNQIASRPELAGAYILFEQAEPNSYVWTAKDPLICLLVLVDDLCRGARKEALLNYFGTFGAVASAVGASIWSTGYFLSQRRFSLRASVGRARPRYHSLNLAGDVGVENDLRRVQDVGMAKRVFTPSAADARLLTALSKAQSPAAVPEWEYKIGNTSAAQAHYTELAARLGAKLEKLTPKNRVIAVHDWLEGASVLASDLVQKGFSFSGSTELIHQAIWLDAFGKWRTYAKQ